jgi:transposase
MGKMNLSDNYKSYTLDHETLEQKNEKRAIACVSSNYGGIQQRWLVIHTQEGKARAIENVNKQIFKMTSKEQKTFDHLCHQTYSCEADATIAVNTYANTLKTTKIIDSNIENKPS